MDQIVSFLETNYFYVVGAGLILIIIIIGALVSSKKAKKAKEVDQNPPMANINDVQTGEINQVSDELKQKEVQPVEVAPMAPEVATEVPEPAAVSEPVDTAMEISSFPEATIKSPEEKFEKTEVIDFSGLDNKQTDSFVADTSQYGSSMLNGEEASQSSDSTSENQAGNNL